jgi:3-oxoacyl-[acyl-carrier protein] reductase
MEIKAKVAIVTGAGQGIGKAIVKELAEVGIKLALIEKNEKSLNRVKKEIEKMGIEVFAYKMDVSCWEDANKMPAKVYNKFGQIDILVNNAGINPKKKNGTRFGILDTNDGLWDNILKVNLKGVFNCSKAVMPYMIKQKFGKIVNIGSITGLTGGAGSPSTGAAYCVSKAGVICLTKYLALELAQYNINVNVLAPGRILTEMAKQTSLKNNAKIKKSTPLGRFAMPKEIAKAVLFLISEDASFMTGETMVIDGGRTLH